MIKSAAATGLTIWHKFTQDRLKIESKPLNTWFSVMVEQGEQPFLISWHCVATGQTDLRSGLHPKPTGLTEKLTHQITACAATIHPSMQLELGR